MFLGILDLLNVVLLSRSRIALERSERGRVVQSARHLASAIGTAALLEALAGDGAARSRAVRALRRNGLTDDLSGVRLLDPDGRDVSGARGPGTALFEGPDALDADGRARLQAGRAVGVRVEPDGGEPLFVALVPVLDPQGRTAGYVEIAARSAELGVVEFRYRTALVVQIAGVVIIAVLVLLFANWISRPYRRLARVAGEAGLAAADSGAGTEPDDLARSFRAVVDKLREQDRALGDLEREAGGLGDLVRFASRSAERMNTGVLVIDRRMTVAGLNAAGARLLEAEPDAARGRSLREVAGDFPSLVGLLERCFRSGTGASREVLPIRLADGRTRHLGVALSLSSDPSGDPAGALILMTDLTEIRQLQEQARLRESLASVGKLSAGIAHEFRNALGTILGYARMLQKRDDPRVQGPARRIVAEIDAVRGTVDEFLLFARPPEPRPVDLDLGRLIRRCAATAPDGIEVTVDGEFGVLRGDEGLVQRVFENLLGNAADSAAEAGRAVLVRISGRPAASGRTLQVEIDDDGPGIPREHLSRVFEPFFTTRKRGTGLGLALVQRTLVDLGGSVDVLQGPRGGALFRLRFPGVRPAEGKP